MDGAFPLSGAAREWFAATFPGGPTPAQRLAWPVVKRGAHLLLVSPTGTGKTLAAFLAAIDGWAAEAAEGRLEPGLRCVYVSPLRSLARDVERNLLAPLAEIRARTPGATDEIRVAVRTGDTSAHQRAMIRTHPPHLLITTPESLSLMLAQAAWREVWTGVEQIVVDEIHALVGNKRGVDLALTLERLARLARRDPVRIGLSATCRPVEAVARFLVGPTRTCEVVEAPPPKGEPPVSITVESLIKGDEAPHRGLTHRRLIKRIGTLFEGAKTTLIFANTRAFAEKLTHDLRLAYPDAAETIAAHHGSLDAARRSEVETGLKAGSLRAVVTSTSLELGVDIGDADLAVLVGLPGSTARCLQRIGRAGHRPGSRTVGLMAAATPAELIGAAVTARAAREGRIEPLCPIDAPLDVLCQQLIAIASLGETADDDAFALVRRAGPMASLPRSDFDACLASLAGELASPPGAYEASPGGAPRWSSPRLWRTKGRFGIRSGRTIRWFLSNVGTINAEESMQVRVDDRPVGRLDAAYAERLQKDDRFILDGRALICRRVSGDAVHASGTAGDAELPRWASDRQGLSRELAADVAAFRYAVASMLAEGRSGFLDHLDEHYGLDGDAAAVVEALIEAQEAASEVPSPETLLVEEFPDPETGCATLAFHAPLGRPGCEALGRGIAARLGRRYGRDLGLSVSDLGWALRLPDDATFDPGWIAALLDPERFDEDVLEGVDRGELVALRFRHVAATALMVLKNPEGGRVKVGGLLWVSRRLYPLVLAATPNHPLIREARREALHDQLDVASALAWLRSKPAIRHRRLDAPSPFACCWIDPSAAESLKFETPRDALKRLHARLTGGGG